MVNTFYWWVPKGTPQDRIDVLTATLKEAIETDYVRERMSEIHTESIFIQSDDLHSRLDRQAKQYKTIMPRKIQTLPNFGLWATASVIVLSIASVLNGMRKPSTEKLVVEQTETVEFVDRH